MNENDRVEQLLTQILETHRAHLDEYKRVTSQSLQLQQQATQAQARHIRLYRRVMLVLGIGIAALAGYVMWLGGHIS